MKLPKTPPLNSKTKLLSFDLETNGLHGQAFAVGAVLMSHDKTVHKTFSARCPIVGTVDQWVHQNVLPAIENMSITHDNYDELREAFWAWYLETEPMADYVLVNNGYPVEYRFLLECQEADLEARYWQHPFPILDLSSLLVQVGQKATNISKSDYNLHNPLDDAKIAALMAFSAFELSGIIL